jgi:hypothetical protein
MISRARALAEWPCPLVRLACGLCPRRGQYRKGTLIRRFGGDVKMPDLRHLIARCSAQGRAWGSLWGVLR